MFYNNLPAKLTVKDVSKFGKWGRSFSFLKPCLAGSNFLFEQASSKIVSKGVCLLILTVILWPSGQSTYTCVAIFLIENHKSSDEISKNYYRTDWRCLNLVCFDFETETAVLSKIEKVEHFLEYSRFFFQFIIILWKSRMKKDFKYFQVCIT